MEKLVLFDIDRTLIKNFPGHKEAFSFAFKKVFGVDTGIETLSYHGMTDPQIIIDVLKQKGLSEKAIETRLAECMQAMVDYFPATLAKYEITILEGVPRLLAELERRRILMGLVTGNLEPIARGKLNKAGLSRYFKFGGFGSDNRKRANLVKIAISRAENGFSFKRNNNVVLLGDTPEDVKAGKKSGVKTIAVATGVNSFRELTDTGADFVLKNLSDTEKVLKIIL